MRSSLIRCLLVASALVANAAHAHHSFSAMYDATKPVRLAGTLSKVEWTNPHSYFFLDVKGADGKVTTWACEGAGPGALSRRGFKRTDIKIGDKLIVDGYLARSGGNIIDARRVTLPNGRVVSGGAAGDGGPDSGTAKPAS
jgi:predicted small integral membrane protein